MRKVQRGKSQGCLIYYPGGRLFPLQQGLPRPEENHICNSFEGCGELSAMQPVRRKMKETFCLGKGLWKSNVKGNGGVLVDGALDGRIKCV